MDRTELERLDRERLVARAQAAGIARARLLTRPELVDELLRRDPGVDARSLKKSRGFFGLARDLLSRVVERGLHLPDAADRLRVALGEQLPHVPRPEPQAVPTVTLAEIYAAQGHKQRALETLLRVLEAEPDHGAARTLLERLESLEYVPPSPPLPPEPDEPRDEIGAHLGSAQEDDRSTPPPAPEKPILTTAIRVTTEPPVIRDATSRGEAECVAIPLDDGRTYIWWRLDGVHVSTQPFVVRVLVLVPTWDGPRRETRDIPMAPEVGELMLSDLPERAIVRVAIGKGEGADFVPLAHSPALERSRENDLLRWTPDGRFPIAATDRLASSIARASEAARR